MAAPNELHPELRLQATYHFQFMIETTSEAKLGLGYMSVSGPVVRVFRGPSSMIGQHVNFRISTFCEGDRFPPGGEGRFPAGNVKTGKIIETYVDENYEGAQLINGCTALLDQPSDASAIEAFGHAENVDHSPARGLTPKMVGLVAVLVVGLAIVLFIALS